MISHHIKRTSTRSNKALSLMALCVGFFMVIVDVNIVNIALPSISRDLNGKMFWLQWVVDGYTLTFACLLLMAGALGDQLGAKNIYLAGLIMFVITSLACGVADHFLSLTIFRLLQGISAAFLVPTSLSLINSSFKTSQERTTAIGIWASVGGIAAASGPVLGALMTAWHGWRAVFLINIPLGIVGIVLALKYVENTSKPQKVNFDIPGQITGMISIALLAFTLIDAGKSGWQSESVIVGAAFFLLSFATFFVIEYFVLSPMLPLRFFKSKIFSTSVVVGMIINLCGYGILFLLPFYFQHIKSYSILVTGLAITPFSVLAALGSYFSGKISGRIGPKVAMISGLLIAASGFFMLLLAGAETHYLFLLFPLILMGIGGAITMPSATIAVINAVPEGRAGIAVGVFNTSRQIGSLIGVAVFGALANTAVNFINGMHSALLIAGSLSLLACIATLCWIEL